jgi:ferredoxin
MSEPCVISRLCRDCVDGACVEACPVDCIYERREGADLPNQLFIDAEECICCSACEPACPWEAIFEMDNVPREFEDDIALNALTTSRPGDFVLSARLRDRPPQQLAEQVAANKRKWEPSTDGSATGAVNSPGHVAAARAAR